jgi:hypothetical protein
LLLVEWFLCVSMQGLVWKFVAGERRTADPLYLEGGGIFVENVAERG